MVNKFLKNYLFEKFREFGSYLILIFLVLLSIIVISYHENFKKNQINSLERILDNTYFQKTLLSISKTLNPRFEKIVYLIESGESFETILNKLEIQKVEKKAILDHIINEKIKFNIYENQKITFEIDNLTKKKIKKIIIPINKKKILYLQIMKITPTIQKY